MKANVKELEDTKYPKSRAFFVFSSQPLGTMTLYQVNIICTFAICIQNHVNTACQKDLYITDLFEKFPFKKSSKIGQFLPILPLFL